MGNLFTIFTDNNPLSHLRSARLGAVEQRWASQLASFDFEIKYRPGHSNWNTEALSRQYLDPLVLGVEVPPVLSLRHPKTLSDHFEVQNNEIMALPWSTFRDLASLQECDPIIGPL